MAAFSQQMLAYHQVLAELRLNTSKILTQEVKRELIKIFIKKVYLDLPAPRIFRLIIDWRDESWGVTEMIFLRERGQAPSWSDEEDTLLRQLYPVATIEELLSKLPNRALAAIRHRALRLHIKRGEVSRFARRENGNPWNDHLSWTDLKYTEAYGLNNTNWIYDRSNLEEAFRATNINAVDNNVDDVVGHEQEAPFQSTLAQDSSCNPARDRDDWYSYGSYYVVA